MDDECDHDNNNKEEERLKPEPGDWFYSTQPPAFQPGCSPQWDLPQSHFVCMY